MGDAEVRRVALLLVPARESFEQANSESIRDRRQVFDGHAHGAYHSSPRGRTCEYNCAASDRDEYFAVNAPISAPIIANATLAEYNERLSAGV